MDDFLFFLVIFFCLLAYEKNQDKKNSDFENKIKELSITNKIFEEKIKKTWKRKQRIKRMEKKKIRRAIT